ncbi:MAG TPA: hypothetical protein GX740_01910 [Acholeplasmataceae bacterium]|jgi:hypothetical protein|nr:hypothetical protein [Acholeplasmataceae bacterium]
MTLIYVISAIIVAGLSLRSIANSLKKGAVSYEYARSEAREDRIYDNYVFANRK